ncbi:MAG: chitinase [Chloroflexota bacterium]
MKNMSAKFFVMLSLLALLTFMLVSGLTVAQEATETAPDNFWVKQYYAPYMDMGRYPTIKLVSMAQETDVRYFTLAFVLAGYKNCKPAWYGVSNLNNPNFLDDLAQLRALGGDVIVSFGGAGGTELAINCADAETLAAAYQTVVDTLGVTHLDFDIEGGTLANTEATERRSQALALLQANAEKAGQPIHISFTLSVLTTGLLDDSLALLQSAKDAGVNVDTVNIMTMNFEDSAPVDKMGENTIQAATSVFGQLKILYPDKTDAELWGMIGITPMIGVNDRSQQIFTLDDAGAVTKFAQEKGLQRIAIWSLDRDQPCEFEQSVVSNKCSSVDQKLYDFSAAFNMLTDSVQ